MSAALFGFVIKSICVTPPILQEKLVSLVLKDKLYDSGVRAFEGSVRS